MIPAQLVEQLSTPCADGRGSSDTTRSKLQGARRRPSRYTLTFEWPCGISMGVRSLPSCQRVPLFFI
jgi:hypothetical protein